MSIIDLLVYLMRRLKMEEQLWVAIVCLLSWASLPVVMIFANAVFDKDVVKEGESAGHH